jgi:S-adenosylmethionine:tRNA ribosyltransferase-isomerase
MRRRDFDYELPTGLIAQAPLRERSGSRMLCLDGRTGMLADRRFADIGELLAPGDLLVLNDTRVLPARIRGEKDSGGRVEILLERVTGRSEALVQLRASHNPAAGRSIRLDGGAVATVTGRQDDLFRIELDRDALEYFETHGETPLPPYIDRPPNSTDAVRYQTVFARKPGAVAAPTAGLHFDEALLAELASRGIAHAFLTLHVGAGTFSPLRVEDVDKVVLHEERLHVGPALCSAIAEVRERAGRVIAVGTTVVRALEAAASGGRLEPVCGTTALFIYPGFRFRVVDALVTNFHLPQSSLLMLVAAFAGRDNVLGAYRHAVAEAYRFFSYGDAMFITPTPEARRAL